MRVGFVRNVGLAALGLAVAVTAACNDDPLSFDNDTTVDIYANPSSMTVPAGMDVKLATRAINQGGEATWAEVVPVVVPACVTLVPDPERTEIQPPGLFLVTGGAVVGDCTITLTAGGVSKEVDVGNVAGAIRIIEPPVQVNFGQSVQFNAAIFTMDEPPSVMGPFENSDADWTSDAPGVASVDEGGVVTGVSSGEANIEACWSSLLAVGYEICDAVKVLVLVAPPTITGLSPNTGDSFMEVTVQGSGLVSAHEVFIGGTFPQHNFTYLITSVTDTELKFIWPALPEPGIGEDFGVLVGIAPDDLVSAGIFVQLGGIEAEPNEPLNDLQATTPIGIDAGGSYIGGFGGGDDFDWIEITVGVDGSYAPVVDWNQSGQDIDLYIYDSGLTELCHSWYGHPEDECGTLELTAGTYWAEVQDYSGGVFNSTYRFYMYDMN